MSEARKSYYKENREKILAKNKEYYHKKKEDPEFYKSLLERNQEYYRNGTRKNRKVLTEEEEEAYFQKIRRDIVSLRETKIEKAYPLEFGTTDPYLLMTIHNLVVAGGQNPLLLKST
jgi:hypothetical protein